MACHRDSSRVPMENLTSWEDVQMVISTSLGCVATLLLSAWLLVWAFSLEAVFSGVSRWWRPNVSQDDLGRVGLSGLFLRAITKRLIQPDSTYSSKTFLKHPQCCGRPNWCSHEHRHARVRLVARCGPLSHISSWLVAS